MTEHPIPCLSLYLLDRCPHENASPMMAGAWPVLLTGKCPGPGHSGWPSRVRQACGVHKAGRSISHLTSFRGLTTVLRPRVRTQ